MAIATILINEGEPTNADVCDDLLDYGIVIVRIGTRPSKYARAKEIEQELKSRLEGRQSSSASVILYTVFVGPERYDFDVLAYKPRINPEQVTAAVEKIVGEWRQRGEPVRFHTYFECDPYDDDGDEDV
ncbi:hypothetical protein [Ralstonia pseudosolanacearum]|uniref:hypothetical protein n=1 Tax=Ralstonia pseudosolanacearum TaxID=1310165 RepID=UPI004053BF11